MDWADLQPTFQKTCLENIIDENATYLTTLSRKQAPYVISQDFFDCGAFRKQSILTCGALVNCEHAALSMNAIQSSHLQCRGSKIQWNGVWVTIQTTVSLSVCLLSLPADCSWQTYNFQDTCSRPTPENLYEFSNWILEKSNWIPWKASYLKRSLYWSSDILKRGPDGVDWAAEKFCPPNNWLRYQSVTTCTTYCWGKDFSNHRTS